MWDGQAQPEAKDGQFLDSAFRDTTANDPDVTIEPGGRTPPRWW